MGARSLTRRGSARSVKRLSEIVFAVAVRAGLPEGERLARRLLGLEDRQIGWALEAIRTAAVGRAQGAFAALVGVPPRADVTDWRLQRALQLLSDPGLGVGVGVQQVAPLMG